MIALMGCQRVYEKMYSNLAEIKARGGKMFLIGEKGQILDQNLAEYTFEIPETDEMTKPIIEAIPLQLFAYHIADKMGHDVDQPRNLAKSVTVE